MTIVRLPAKDGWNDHRLGSKAAVSAPVGFRAQSRVCFAAAHVVAGERPDAIDWEGTLAYRHHLWSLGLGVADAMDTAQRGMGLSSTQVRELITRSAAEAPPHARLACGINTDELDGGDHDLDDVVRSYIVQLEFVEAAGSDVVMMASRALAAVATTSDEYANVYERVLSQASRPVILHWLGPMFDPRLTGYWGSTDPGTAMAVLLQIIEDNADVVDGVKVSMLDADLERDLRRRLPTGVRCYTGDDFNYPDLILGDDTHHSDALLGIFDGIAPVAAAALQALDRDEVGRYHQLLAPTVPLSRHIFSAPTYHYKTGLVFLAYLRGHHDRFRMLDGQETARSMDHLGEIVRLADAAGLFIDPDDVARRATAVFMGAD